jgi:hypothetical protein
VVIVPFDDDDLVLCDECHKAFDVAEDGIDLRLPWREFMIYGWVGRFHACCDGCEAAVRERYERDG